jgi:hypothetical protein
MRFPGMTESALIAFYRGPGVDHAGRRFDDILAWDDRRREVVHDYIQWLFPLPEPSRFNPRAPLLSDADVAAFRADPALTAQARRALDTMLAFFGLRRAADAVVRAETFADRAPAWLEPANHNHLRLTRILRFLTLVGCVAEARQLLACLEDIAAHEGAGRISAATLGFWRDAVDAAGS